MNSRDLEGTSAIETLDTMELPTVEKIMEDPAVRSFIDKFEQGTM